MAMIGLRPKVAGSSRLIPASGPSPGIMPTSVPMMQPKKAYISTSGWNATEKPIIRLLKVSTIRSPTARRGNGTFSNTPIT